MCNIPPTHPLLLMCYNEINNVSWTTVYVYIHICTLRSLIEPTNSHGEPLLTICFSEDVMKTPSDFIKVTHYHKIPGSQTCSNDKLPTYIDNRTQVLVALVASYICLSQYLKCHPEESAINFLSWRLLISWRGAVINIYTVTGTMLLLLPDIIKMSNHRTCLPKSSTSENVEGTLLDNCMAGIEVLCCSIG